jgi:ribosomal protein S18 acetylase RimI-like enzyme
MNAAEEITIIPLTPEHIESLRRGVDIVARERKYLGIVEAAPPDKFREYILNQLSNGDPFMAAIANGEVVGWCDVERYETRSEAHRAVLNIAIRPEYRDRGLGRKLLSIVLDQARDAGLVRVELWVFTDNARAIALYESVGFERQGVVRYISLIDHKFRDGVGMAIIWEENAKKLIGAKSSQ